MRGGRESARARERERESESEKKRRSFSLPSLSYLPFLFPTGNSESREREREFVLFLSRCRAAAAIMPSTTVGTIAPAAVVLAGERSGALYPLDAVGRGSIVGVGGGIASSGASSSSPSSSSSPPSPLLLPLAGAPLISYPLRALEATGVRRIIVVSSCLLEREIQIEREH